LETVSVNLTWKIENYMKEIIVKEENEELEQRGKKQILKKIRKKRRKTKTRRKEVDNHGK
jgi:hypothetical protein